MSFLFVIAFGVAAIPLLAASGQAPRVNSVAVRAALARGDWYSALAEYVGQNLSSAPVRAVRGYCLLMLNRNDKHGVIVVGKRSSPNTINE
jgi:hypothetical protein